MTSTARCAQKSANIQGQVLAIILSAPTSKGGVILFRYPIDCTAKNDGDTVPPDSSSNNPFSVKNPIGFHDVTNQFHRPFGIDKNGLITYSDKVLSNFLTVHSDMSDKNFDIKVDDVQFVGYPVTLMHSRLKKKSGRRDGSGHGTTTVNVVFALPEVVSEQSKACYHQLSKQVAMAIKHEERRCCYFCTQKAEMTQIIDDSSNPSMQDGKGNDSKFHSSLVMLQRKTSLAVTLKNIYESVASKGVVLELMNNWTEINFCLPIKAHNLPFESVLSITESDIERCLNLLRPYHAMLLLVDSKELINQLPIDSSPALIRVLRVTTPLKNLQELAADSDLELSQVFKLVRHLVYWAKATIIYPLCEPNVYVLSPNAPTSVKSPLFEKFEKEFPGKLNSNCLTEILSEFSLPSQLDEHSKITDAKAKKFEKVQMVIWMLRRRLLMQLHTYIYIKPVYLEENSSHKYSHKSGYPQPEILNPKGRSMLHSISDQENETIFTRLCHYFDGTHHLEEIMFYENMSRTDLLNIIDKYLPLLYKMQSPDPATSYYVKCP